VLYDNEDVFDSDDRVKYWINNETKEYEVISKYDPAKTYYVTSLVSKYPNLDFSFEFTNPNEKLYSVQIYDGDGNIFWERKSLKETIIDEDFLKYGPDGSFMVSQLYKSPTAENWFEFNNEWTIVDEDGTRVVSKTEPTGISVKGNARLYPKFTTHIQSYQITIKSKHPKTGEVTTLKKVSYDYGTNLASVVLDYIPYITDDTLSLFQGYDFLGYSLVDGSKTIVSDKFTVTNHAELWTVFEFVEDMRKVAHSEWFIINENGAVSPKYKLGGKITIPNKINDIDVKSINNFGSTSPNLTHVFLQNGNLLNTLSNYCFSFRSGNSNVINSILQYFDFEQATNLTTVG
jgi:hypothetical protein